MIREEGEHQRSLRLVVVVTIAVVAAALDVSMVIKKLIRCTGLISCLYLLSRSNRQLLIQNSSSQNVTGSEISQLLKLHIE
jgi:hypothetical protein